MLLLRDPTVDGMKTGYTAGRRLLPDRLGAPRVPEPRAVGPGGGQRRLLSVLLNTSSTNARADESQRLLNWGYTAFDAVRLFEAGKPVATPPVWKGKRATAPLGAPGAVFVTVPKGEGAKLQTRIERTDPLVAPLQKGQRVGTLKVSTAAGTPVAEVPLVLLEAVEQAGIVGRAWDALRLWIK